MVRQAVHIGPPVIVSRTAISAGVNATSGGASGAARLVIISQNTRHLTTHSIASKLVSRPVVRSFDCSAWHADYHIRPSKH